MSLFFNLRNLSYLITNKMQFLLSIADNLYEPVVDYQTSS